MIIERVGGLINSFNDRPAIYITPAGSMFDDKEVPAEVQLEIFKLIIKAGYRAVKTETRPEFLTEEKLQEIRVIVGDETDLEIGLGLESANRWVLKNCINKMLSLDSIKNSIELCHQFDATVYTHILTNPPFLNEFEAIQDALDSTRWAFEQGSDLVGIAFTNVKPGTVTYRLMQLGLYNTPSYWTLIRILLEMPESFRNRLGLFGNDSSVPILCPMSSCPKCTTYLRSMLDGWCYTGDFSFIVEADRYPCSCKKKWEKNLSIQSVPLKDRVANFYEILARDIYDDLWWQENQEWVLQELNTPPEIVYEK